MGFDLFKINALQGSFFKQAKHMVSTPQRAQPVVVISETGAISKEILPMYTGFVSADLSKKAWIVLHSLKFGLMKNGQPIEGEQVLLISERSYKPLDPYNEIDDEDKKLLVSLDDIASQRHDDRAQDVSKNNDRPNNLAQFIMTGSFIIWGLMIIGALIRSRGG